MSEQQNEGIEKGNRQEKKTKQIRYDIVTPDERPPQPKDIDEIEY